MSHKKKTKSSSLQSRLSISPNKDSIHVLEKISELQVNIIYQSKVTEGLECKTNMILMHPSDMKLLDIDPGSTILVEKMILHAWPSKLLISPKSAILHKIWKPNFEINLKDRFVVLKKLMENYFVVDCQRIFITPFTKSEFSKTIDFQKYLCYLLHDVIFLDEDPPVVMFQCPWFGKSIIFEILDFVDDESEASKKLKDSKHILYRITDHTLLTIGSKDETNLFIESSSDNILCNIQKQFGAYNNCIIDSIKLIKLSQSFLNLKEKDNSHISKCIKRPRGLLIYGSPGTGKTLLMNLLAKECQCHVKSIKSNILTKKYDGEAERALESIFEEAKTCLSPSHFSILLIDDIDLIFPNRTVASDEQKRLITCLLTLMDGFSLEGQSIDENHVFIIATSSKPQNIDPAFRRPGRLDKEIELVVPSGSDRECILKVILNSISNANESVDNLSFLVNVSMEEIKEIASLAHGMVGSDLLLVVKQATLHAIQSSSIDDKEYEELIQQVKDLSLSSPNPTHTKRNIVITAKHLRHGLSKITPSALREVVIEIPNVHWSDIGGMQYVKQSLQEVVEWPLLYPELFVSMGISPPKGVLLFGPPGCSKTLMAKALATESSMNFLAIRGPELLSKWLGESEKAIQTLFRRARAVAPSIIFFDEIDALTGKRGTSNSGVSDRVLSQLLTELDGIQNTKQVIIIAATNRPDMMDAALLRPGRIDRKIYVGPPDDLSRHQIFELELSKVPISSDIDISILVSLSQGFSGAEVVSSISEAAYLAIDENSNVITQSHLIESIKSIKPQINEEMIKFYENLSKQFF